MDYISGHCSQGNHEGTKNLSVGGSLLPSCSGVYGGGFWGSKATECTCSCHQLFKQMQEFIAENASDTSEITLPVASPLISTSTNTQTHQAPVTVTHAPSIMAPTAPGVPPNHPDDEPKKTESGRRARGTLDWEVKKICDYWVTTYPGMPLRPAICAELIDKENPPSAGAVDAVWRRWVEIGFATTQTKPVAFTGYTPQGIEKGLHRIKYERKKAAQGKRW